jgi:hypothetical protein
MYKKGKTADAATKSHCTPSVEANTHTPPKKNSNRRMEQ